MSVRARLEDALFLWNAGRKEGAWTQVLIAAAATSRIRFPRPITDQQAFRSFIREVTPTIFDGVSPPAPGGITVGFYTDVYGDGVDLDYLFYVHLRCNLVHEAVLPVEVKLSESRIVDGKLVADLQGTGKMSSPLTIPDFWVIHLAKAVALAPENVVTCADLFP